MRVLALDRNAFFVAIVGCLFKFVFVSSVVRNAGTFSYLHYCDFHYGRQAECWMFHLILQSRCKSVSPIRISAFIVLICR